MNLVFRREHELSVLKDDLAELNVKIDQTTSEKVRMLRTTFDFIMCSDLVTNSQGMFIIVILFFRKY